MNAKNRKKIVIIVMDLICIILISLTVILNKTTDVSNINSEIQGYNEEEVTLERIKVTGIHSWWPEDKKTCHAGEEIDWTRLENISVTYEYCYSDGTAHGYHEEFDATKMGGNEYVKHASKGIVELDINASCIDNGIGEDYIYARAHVSDNGMVGDLSLRFEVTVIPRDFTEIKIDSLPTKTTYLEGENFNEEGMELKGICEDKEDTLNSYTVLNGTSLKAGQTSVTVRGTMYEGTEYVQTRTVEVPITVTPRQLTKIEIIQEPNKKQYIEGQNFDRTGMVVKATYNNNTTNDNITNYEVENGSNLKANQTSVTIKYTENNQMGTATRTVNQAITVIPRLNINMGENFTSTENNITYIERINPNTTVKELKDGITTNGAIKIYNGSNEITESTAKLATGMKMNISLGSQTKEYKIVVLGDLRGRGEMKDADLLKMVRYKAGLDRNLTGEYLRATDLNKNGKFAEDVDLLKMVRVLARLDSM